ncbi:MAG: WbqC family protein [Flavobacteriaceae bacterium]
MKFLLHPTYCPDIITAAVAVQKDICWEVWDNYQKQTYRNRCYICTDQGRHMLSIPIKHAGGAEGRQLYRDVRPDNQYPWQRLHWRSLETAYRSSPFFEFFEEDFAPLFHRKFDFLLDFNFQTIETITQCLDQDNKTEQTTHFQKETDSMIDARFLVNAKAQPPSPQSTYTQVFQDKHGFVSGLSVLDLIFNEGNSALDYLQNINLNFSHA